MKNSSMVVNTSPTILCCLLFLYAAGCAELSLAEQDLLNDTNNAEDTSTGSDVSSDEEKSTDSTSESDDASSTDTPKEDTATDDTGEEEDTATDDTGEEEDTATDDTGEEEDTATDDTGTEPEQPACDQPGEVLDTEHNLCWEEPPSSTTYDLSAAESYCASLTLDEATNWHVATVNELRTIIADCPSQEDGGACGVTDSCTQDACDNVSCGACNDGGSHTSPLLTDQTDAFLSSTEATDHAGQHWNVNFDNGFIFRSNDNSVSFVRCVRSLD